MKLTQNGNSFIINNKIPYKLTHYISNEDTFKCTEFASNMTYGVGHHRADSWGNSIDRETKEIYSNALAGKIAEVATHNYLSSIYKEVSDIDYSILGYGEWDGSDLIADGINFSVKSTSHFGNLLLLPVSEYDNEAKYIPNMGTDKPSQYDYHIFVRVCFNKNGKLNDPKKIFLEKVEDIKWECQVLGYVSSTYFKEIIKDNQIIPKDSLLNGKIPIKVDNYYIQSGDMQKCYS